MNKNIDMHVAAGGGAGGGKTNWSWMSFIAFTRCLPPKRASHFFYHGECQFYPDMGPKNMTGRLKNVDMEIDVRDNKGGKHLDTAWVTFREYVAQNLPTVMYLPNGLVTYYPNDEFVDNREPEHSKPKTEIKGDWK